MGLAASLALVAMLLVPAPATAHDETAPDVFTDNIIAVLDQADDWDPGASAEEARADARAMAESLLAVLLDTVPGDCLREDAWIKAWLMFADLYHVAGSTTLGAMSEHWERQNADVDGLGKAMAACL